MSCCHLRHLSRGGTPQQRKGKFQIPARSSRSKQVWWLRFGRQYLVWGSRLAGRGRREPAERSSLHFRYQTKQKLKEGRIYKRWALTPWQVSEAVPDVQMFFSYASSMMRGTRAPSVFSTRKVMTSCSVPQGTCTGQHVLLTIGSREVFIL